MLVGHPENYTAHSGPTLAVLYWKYRFPIALVTAKITEITGVRVNLNFSYALFLSIIFGLNKWREYLGCFQQEFPSL